MLPKVYSKKVQHAIENGELDQPTMRLAFIREIVTHFEGRLPDPTSEEYTAIAQKICNKYPCLKDAKSSRYWVSKLCH